MIHIKRFIDRTSGLDSSISRDFVMPASEARMLRDEIAKYLLDLVDKSMITNNTVDVQISGGKFK